MIEQVKKQKRIKKDLEEVKYNLDLIRNSLKLLRKRVLVEKIGVSRNPRPPLFKNFNDNKIIFGLQLESLRYYTKDEYKKALYKKSKSYSLSEKQINSYYSLTLDAMSQLGLNFKPDRKDEIFFEHSESESSEIESESSRIV